MSANFKKIGLVAAVAAAPALFVNANASDTAQANATATIIQAISLANSGDLAFGSIVAAATAGTVVISNTGAETCTTVTCVASTRSAAAFTITGEAGYAYTVTLPTADVTLSDGATTPSTMTVNSFTHNASGTLASSTENFSVGATLNVGANQTAGAYTGTFDVTVAYN